MNAIAQHRLGSDCALCDAHSKAADRHTARPHIRTRRYGPWIAPLLLTAVVVPFVEGPDRWVLLGIVAGLAAGAGFAWLGQMTTRHIAATTLASATDELKAESDQRVAMVIRQFEWAVNDVANLRDAVQRAQEGRAEAEANERRVRRRLHMLERQLYDARTKIGEYSRVLGKGTSARDEEPTVLPTSDELIVPLTWHVFEEKMLTWLRFESAGIVPSQIRILNEHDSVIAISAHALDTLEEGAQVALVVRAPEDVVATLEGRQQGRFTFQALVDDTWCAVELKAVDRRAMKMKGKRGRAWHPGDDRRPQTLIA